MDTPGPANLGLFKSNTFDVTDLENSGKWTEIWKWSVSCITSKKLSAAAAKGPKALFVAIRGLKDSA